MMCVTMSLEQYLIINMGFNLGFTTVLLRTLMSGRKLVELVPKIGPTANFRCMLCRLLHPYANVLSLPISTRYLQKFETHVPLNGAPLPENTERGTSGPIKVCHSFYRLPLTPKM